jgi:putative restriction endonuclease
MPLADIIAALYDHPTNGIALSKNHHWAFDRHLIAPRFTDTGLAWTVSPLLDDRIEGHRELLDLEGRSVLLPKERKFHPAPEAVAWRAERLMRVG